MWYYDRKYNEIFNITNLDKFQVLNLTAGRFVYVPVRSPKVSYFKYRFMILNIFYILKTLTKNVGMKLAPWNYLYILKI